MIPGQKRQIEQLLGHRDLAVARQIEDRLHLMGERGDVLEAEHGAGPLDGVHGAEDPVDDVVVGRIRLQFEQRRFKFTQEFERFFFECLTVQFFSGHLCSGEGGLTQQFLGHCQELIGFEGFDDPAGGSGPFPSSLAEACDSVVSMTMGVNYYCGVARTARHKVRHNQLRSVRFFSAARSLIRLRCS